MRGVRRSDEEDPTHSSKKKFDYYQFSTLRIEKNIYQVYQNVLKLEKGAINN